MTKNSLRDSENGQLLLFEESAVISEKCWWLLEQCIFSDKERFEEAKEIILSLGDGIYDEVDIWGKNIKDIVQNNPTSALLPLSKARDYGFYEREKFQASNYMKYFKPRDLLNENCMFLPFWKLKSNYYLEDILFKFGADELFIKPNSGFKSFTGFTAKEKNIAKELSYLTVDDNEMCLVAPKYHLIDDEFRFWIIDKKIVTYSQYSWENDNHVEVPREVYEFANRIVSESDLDFYTLDIGATEDNYYIIEVNNIYTSGTYRCDLKKLIVALRDYAIREWKEIYE